VSDEPTVYEYQRVDCCTVPNLTDELRILIAAVGGVEAGLECHLHRHSFELTKIAG
jgi:hypothetical protein